MVLLFNGTLQGMSILYSIVGICVVWSIWGYFSSRVEQAAYSVLASKKGYEIRLYPQHLVAQTTVTGSYSESLSQGFRIVAGYIFGGNAKKERVAMTSPVAASIEGESRTVAFGMPRSHTRDTLPVPTDPRVQIVSIPEKKMAVLRFSWIRTDARIAAKKKELLSSLQKDRVITVGESQYAGYNAPWTPPWMTRHEVLIEIKQ